LLPAGTPKAAPRKRGLGRGRILIVGLGNLLLQDDGVGVHAVRELQKLALPGVLAVEVGTAILDALHLLEKADKILAIDAMQAGGLPGTIYSFGVGDVADGSPQLSLHELSLLATLRFLPQRTSPQITVLGMEPETIDFGLDLSPALQANLPKLVQAAVEIVAQWREEPTRENRNQKRDSRSPLSEVPHRTTPQ
jgi:hydrogenase maturation protease